MTKRQWKNLLNAIHHGNCILMLGPAVSSREQNHQFTPFSQLFAEELAEELEEEKVDYAKEHRQNLSYISQLYEKINDVSPLDAVYAAKDFYKAQAQQPNSIHQTLAELPFHLILNTTPDDLMFKAMRKAGNFQTHHQHYNFSKNKSKKADFDKDAETNWDEPTKSNPLIYNLFGFYEVPASLVLSQTQQVVFTSAVVSKNPRIPTAISSQFDGSKTYLFLGFDWEEWHLPLLLGSFNLHQQQEGN
ncbi:MAG: SIR2 family protein, partial [Chitinophagales bacterium]